MAHGNFTPEAPPSTEAPRTKDRSFARDTLQQSEIPVSTAKQDDPTYMAVIIGVLTAVILLLAVAIFLIVSRHRQRKNFASPLGAKSAIPTGNHQHLSPESAYGTTEKDPSLMTYRVEEYDDRYAGTKLTTLPRDLNDRLLSDVRLDEYQEPFHDNKYREPPQATYYGYSTVVIDNKDLHDNIEQSGECLTRFHSLSFSLPFRESAKRYIGYLSSYRMIDKWNLLFVCFEQMLHMTMQCPCRYQVSAVIRTVSSPSLHRGAALRYIINIITLPDF